ncbi:MAG: sterol desaturase family protein, partial [Methylocystis sp.]|nr:sterol desaturase family protein [Methylocystis sp.]
MIGSLSDRILSRVSSEALTLSALLLMTALGSALVVYWRSREKKSLRDFASFLAPRELLTHPSARADFAFWITRRMV